MDNMDFDPPLSSEQERLVHCLTVEQVQIIDSTLVANSTTKWRKVAMVVSRTMVQLSNSSFKDIPDVYYSNRVAQLVALGILEAQGNLRRMRYSEVRQPDTI